MRAQARGHPEQNVALTLSRFPGESILIGGNVRVLIVKVSGNQVRIRIEAPPNVKILREELLAQPPPPDDTNQQTPAIGGPVETA